MQRTGPTGRRPPEDGPRGRHDDGRSSVDATGQGLELHPKAEAEIVHGGSDLQDSLPVYVFVFSAQKNTVGQCDFSAGAGGKAVQIGLVLRLTLRSRDGRERLPSLGIYVGLRKKSRQRHV